MLSIWISLIGWFELIANTELFWIDEWCEIGFPTICLLYYITCNLQCIKDHLQKNHSDGINHAIRNWLDTNQWRRSNDDVAVGKKRACSRSWKQRRTHRCRSCRVALCEWLLSRVLTEHQRWRLKGSHWCKPVVFTGNLSCNAGVDQHMELVPYRFPNISVSVNADAGVRRE